MDSFVNILIPFYNNEATLQDTLTSVDGQTSSKWKVILIDDGSTDSSPLIARTFLNEHPGKVKLIESPRPRSGPAIGRNTGLNHADGLYVMCLDSDDLLAPFCLEQRLSVMQQHPELHWAVFNQYQCSPGDTLPYKIFNKPVKTREAAIEVFLKLDVAWQTMAPLWKTETLSKLRFDETLYPSEDPDLHLRALLDRDIELKICTDLPADCYYNVANKTGDKLLLFYNQSIQSRFRFIRKTIEYLPLLASKQKLQFYYRYLRKGFFDFYKVFLLARMSAYIQELKEINLLLEKEKVLSKKDILKLNGITMIFTSTSPIIKKFKLRGLVQRLFLTI